MATSACSLLTGPQYRDQSGQVTATASVATTALQVGDCLLNVSDMSDQVGKVVVVPCADEHEAEVYAVGTKQSNTKTALEQYCTDQFAPYIGIDFQDSTLEVTYIHSDSTSTTTDVQCIVYDPGVMVTSTYKGSEQ